MECYGSCRVSVYIITKAGKHQVQNGSQNMLVQPKMQVVVLVLIVKKRRGGGGGGLEVWDLKGGEGKGL